MRSNIKGRWQPGHRWESFHWFIIYTVPAIYHSQSHLILNTQASTQTLCHLATRSCTIQQRAFGRKYSSCKICFNVLNCVFITRHSLVERRARYLFYCMFVCLFGQRFLSNPRADSRQSSHAGVAWVGTSLLPFWELAAPGGRKKGQMKFSLL